MIPHYILFWAIVGAICAYAWLRGRTEEKIAATTCALAVLATHFIIGPVAQRYAHVEFGLLGIDIAVLASFVGIALYSSRFWPLWASGFQLTVSMSHGMKAIDLGLMPRAYAAAAVFWSYPILIVILVGIWRTDRKRSQEAAQGAVAS